MTTGTIAGTIFRGAAAHGVPLHTLAKGEGGHVGIRIHALLHVAAPHALGAAACALSTRSPQGTWRAALLGTVVRRPFTDTAVEWVDAGGSLQAPSARFRQDSTESSVTGLRRHPLKQTICKRRHILPAPVGHIDLSKANPRG